MDNLDWDWLMSKCRAWFFSGENDVKAMETLTALKDEAETKGFARIQVSKVIHKIRKLEDDKSNIQQSDAAVPEAKPEPTPQAQPTPPTPTKVDATPRARAQLRSRTQESLPTVPGLNPSGGKQRQSKYSIVDIGDGKQTI